MGKRITAGIIAALMLFMVAAPGSAVRADGAENVTPGDAARTTSDGGSDEDIYIDEELSENLRRAAIDAGVDKNGDGKISVAEAEEKTSLTADHWAIHEIKGIEYFNNLEYLDLTCNKIKDISALVGLTNLKHLDLTDNEISDIRALAGLTNLEYLDLTDNEISDISALAGLMNLEYLDLTDNEISDISALAGLMSLWFLRLNDNEISGISVPVGLTNLRVLLLADNKISAISLPDDLTNLEHLDLVCNKIKDISIPAGLANLRLLYLEYNEISVISLPDDLTNLVYLELFGNQITESEARAKLPQQLLDDTEWFERQGFLKDEVPEPEPEPQPGDKYEIDLGDGDTGIGSDAFEELLKKNKHCTVEINLDNGVRFSFEMGSMHVVEGKDVYDFGCTLIRNYENLPPAMQNVIRNNSFVTRILYNYSGKLPGTVSIRIYVGKQYAGQTLYYYRENKDNTFTFMQEALVDADGYITVQQDHCSDYVLLGEKRENNTPGGPGTDTPSGTTPGSPSDLTLDTPANGTPGTSSDSAPSTAIDVLSGTANPLPVTQAAATLAGSTTAPKTGDDNAVTVHMMLLLVSMTGILTACIGIAGRRRRVLPGRKQ